MKTNEGDTRRNEKITLSSDNKMTVRELTEIMEAGQTFPSAFRIKNLFPFILIKITFNLTIVAHVGKVSKICFKH